MEGLQPCLYPITVNFVSARCDRSSGSLDYRGANSRHNVAEQVAQPDREQAGELSR
jgi:hypothetical protein